MSSPRSADNESNALVNADATLPESAEDTARGRLSPATRRALIELLRSGAVLASNKPLVYAALVRDSGLIASHLADMYLRCLIDEPAGVVILLQEMADEDTEDLSEFAALTTTRTLSLYDTLLALVLRKHYQERQTAGDQQIFIDYDQIETKLAPFLPLTNSEQKDRRKLNGAIERMKERKLIASVRADEERFEITPVIRYVVNAEFLDELLASYRKLLPSASERAP